MSDPYLEEIKEAIEAGGFRDLHGLAKKVGISYESLCASLNNGMLKGYWRLRVVKVAEPDTQKCPICLGKRWHEDVNDGAIECDYCGGRGTVPGPSTHPSPKPTMPASTPGANSEDRYREALEWALDCIGGDSPMDENGTPKHECEYLTNPENGHCEFHHKYWEAKNLLAHPSEGDKEAPHE